MSQARLRVAMIAPPWLPVPPDGYGGIENVIDALVPALLKRGVEVELFTVGESTVKATKRHWLYDRGQYEHIHKPQYDTLPISAAHVVFALNAIRRDGGFDVIHDHNWFSGPLALAYTGSEVPPVVHTIHNPPFSTPDRVEQGTPDNLPMWREFASSDKLYLVAISEALKAAAPAELAGRMLGTVHNAVDVELFPFESVKDEYFITLARFHPDKGQDIAVRICAELGLILRLAGRVGDISSHQRLMLELANPLSPYRGLTEFRYYSDQIFPYLFSGKISHIGEVAGQKKFEFISKAKALLFPIQWDEPFGMAPIEALACGTPVVTMNRGAMPEIIEHGVNGFLANDEDEFREYVMRVGELDPAACRRSVEEKFSANRMAERYIERYREAIARTPR